MSEQPSSGFEEPRQGYQFEPRWLVVSEVLALHARQIARFGGPVELRNAGALESALDRPRNKWSFGERDLSVIASAYAYGIARNHPFVDANKRTAFHTAITFLRANGVRFKPTQSEAATMTLALASGAVGEEGYGRWIKDRWPS